MEVAGANRRWRLPFRCRGSRRESAVAQLFSLGSMTLHRSFRLTPMSQTEVSALVRRAKRGAMVTALVLAVFSLYALSSGPAIYLQERGWISLQTLRVVYAPLGYVMGESLLFANYCNWWMRFGVSR